MAAKVRRLNVSTPQGKAGFLTKESLFAFNYTATERSSEISLTMPIRAASYTGGALLPIFEMNRPEGFLLDRIRQKFVKEGGLDDMQLLHLTGGNQIGRLRHLADDTVSARQRPTVGRKEVLTHAASQELFDFLVDTYLASGISGFQPKVMFPDADRTEATAPAERATFIGGDLIVKASGDDFPLLTQNEFLCMEAARLAGLDVPPFWLSNDNSLFVMERFDFRNGEQLGFEDMAVLMAKRSDEKYNASYEAIARVVDLFCQENALESKRRLFEYVTLSVIVRNGDAHLKNFGLLYDHPNGQAPTLAPIYDVVTTSIYAHENSRTGETKADRTLALNLNKDKRYPTRKELVEFGRTVCQEPHATKVIDRIADAARRALDEHRPHIEASLWDKLNDEWTQGWKSLAPTTFYGPKKSSGSKLSM